MGVSCTRCEGSLGKANRTGYCKNCWPKVGFELLRAQDPEAFRLKRSEGIKRGYAENPERLATAQANIRRAAALPHAKEARSRKAKELRIWEIGHAAQGSGTEVRQRMTRSMIRAKLPWCPPELVPEYRRLCRANGVPRPEAKAMILELHEANLRRLRAKMGVTGEVGPIVVPAFRHTGNSPNPYYAERLAAVKAEKARIETLRQSRTICGNCGARSDLGCEHGVAA